MAISVVEICNLALGHLGKNAIQRIDEKSAEAAECRRWYEMCVRQSQESHDWSFCRRTDALALHNEDATVGWSFRYIYPDACLKFRLIWNPAGKDAPPVPYETLMNSDGSIKTIQTNMEGAIGIWTFYQPQTDLFTPYYVDTLSHLLAARMAYKLTGKRSIKGDELNLFNGMIRQASAFDSNEQVDQAPKDADWIQHRDGISNSLVNTTGDTTPWWAQ